MTPRRSVVLSVGSIAFCAALVACFDLFHSTVDVLPLCAIDARAAGCNEQQDADLDGGTNTDFCAWTSDDALLHARHACGWLGACETPMGGNAFGPCMFQALLAYDCAANPNHRLRGKARALWDCMWRVNTCSDVQACVFPKGVQSCAAGVPSTACGTAADETANNLAVRIECGGDGGAAGPNQAAENCGLWGQTCASAGTLATCSGEDVARPCTQDECFGSQLHWCGDGGDVGIDCASNGGQQCGGFPSASSASWVACVAESDAGACTPDASALCTNGSAVSCASGTLETINCGSLLGTSSACSPGKLSPAFDWTSPCVVVPAVCTTDSCAGGTVTGCARGAPFALDCATEGLGACRMVTTDVGRAVHAACTPPG